MLMYEERSMSWEVIVAVIVREKVHMNMCLIVNGYRDTAVSIYKYRSIVIGYKERKKYIVYC
jgi:hypothetical protein